MQDIENTRLFADSELDKLKAMQKDGTLTKESMLAISRVNIVRDRLARLRKINAPQEIIDNDERLLRERVQIVKDIAAGVSAE